VYKYIRMYADNCKIQLQTYLMSVYRDSGAVHFINSHCSIMKCEIINVIKMSFGSVLCTEKAS
jgi:hypothetical protein